MTAGRPQLDDIYLHAYVDGELSDAEAREVELRLQTDATARVLVASLAAQRDALQSKYGLPVNCDVTKKMVAQVLASKSSRRWGAIAKLSGVAALVVAAAMGGYFLREMAEPPAVFADPPFVATAVGAHTVFAPEMRHAVEVPASDERHLVYWLSKRLENPVRVARLEGWTLVGGRLLPDASHPAAQLMYEDANGRRITLFQRAKTGQADQSLRFVAGDTVRAFYWVEGGVAYVVSGALEKFELKGLAQALNASLAAAASSAPADSKP